MRKVLLITSLVAAIAMVSVLIRGNEENATSRLESAMVRHGLVAANIAYGRAQAEPSFVSINAPHGSVRPYYSLSKPITAAAALEVLDLEQKIEGATVRQLLQHSGGWDRAVAGDPVTQRKDVIDCTKLPAPERQFAPGERYAYSNLGYCFLGRAIAESTGSSYRESVIALFPEARLMEFDPSLGPAGGWSGTAGVYFRFAARQLPFGTDKAPIHRSNDIPYGLGWAVGPDFVTHFGALHTNFSLVIKQGDFVAVGLFDGRPIDDASAARDLRSALLELKNGR